MRCRFGHEDVGMVVLVGQSIKKPREDYIEFEADRRKICHHLHVSPMLFEFDSSRYSQRCWAHSSL